MEGRMQEKQNCHDWFFPTQPIEKETVLATLLENPV
jgi:hypothetical protein